MVMPVFVPTPEDRRRVLRMVGIGMTHDQIACIIENPRTRKPIDKNTLEKNFPEELATGVSRLKEMVLNKYIEKVESGTDWAIRVGMSHYHGFERDGTAINIAPSNGHGKPNAEEVGIRVEFVRPKRINGRDDEHP